MKKIGFIYKYNPSEGMGILVFGVWKVKSSWGSTIKNTPILFSDNDLLSKVTAGQLVYFDFNGDKTATNIERASLSNFKVDFINSIVRCGERESEYSFYYDNTKISFESLNCDSLPESITDLFECLGKYKHRQYVGKYKHRQYESITIDVFDLSLWVNQDDLKDKYYGMNVEELKFLYDIFVMRKHYDRKGNTINYKPENDVISSRWALLLSKLSDSDLKVLLYSAPKLQPAFPKEFCKKNVGLLRNDYGMPDVEICKLYCLHKISNTDTVSGYKELKHRLFVYCHCGAKHLEGEGTPMCQMGEGYIKNLEKRLDLRYENVIKQNVISKLEELCDDANVMNDIKNATSDEFNNVGIFLDKYHNLRNNFLRYNVCKETFESYEKLSKLYKDTLKTSLLNCVNQSAILATNSKYLSPFSLGYKIEKLNGWILVVCIV